MHDGYAPSPDDVVYSIIEIVLVSVAVSMFLYTRGLRSKRATLDSKGRMPASREEGISVATEKKEKAGRTGTIT